MMRRWLVGAAMVLVLAVGCGGLVLAVPAAQRNSFVLDDAHDVQISRGSIATMTIRYTVGGPPYTWRERLEARLGQAGWQNQRYFFSGTEATFVADWYYRDHAIGPLFVRESATLAGTPSRPDVAWVRVQYQWHWNW